MAASRSILALPRGIVTSKAEPGRAGIASATQLRSVEAGMPYFGKIGKHLMALQCPTALAVHEWLADGPGALRL